MRGCRFEYLLSPSRRRSRLLLGGGRRFIVVAFLVGIFIASFGRTFSAESSSNMGYIDPSTPSEAQSSFFHDHKNRKLTLVMSDEFNVNGRDFSKGKDSLFEAIEKPDYSNQAIQFYNSSKEYVTTRDGNLVLTTRASKTSWLQKEPYWLHAVTMTKNYTSAMIQTWNKFCFTGGVLELSVDLPGEAYSGGLWPAAWLMGNLARATWEESTPSIWPWSYDKCGAIPELDTKQVINACDKSPGFGFNPNQGRGSPEIDLFEVMPGHDVPDKPEPVKPFMSTSLQVSPGLSKDIRPTNGQSINYSNGEKWYDDLEIGPNGQLNDFWGQECGAAHYMEDAVSVNTWLNETHFNSHHVYRLEWQPGPDGFLNWFLDDEKLLGLKAKSLAEKTGAIIPEEPMYLILNTAISHRWGMPEPCDHKHCSACWVCFDCTNPECQCSLPKGMQNCKNLPAEMSIDYIRLYQDLVDPTHQLGCSPASHPTAGYIAAHEDLFKDWKPYNSTSQLSSGLLGVFDFLLGSAVVIFVFCVILSQSWLLMRILRWGLRFGYGKNAVREREAAVEFGIESGITNEKMRYQSYGSISVRAEN